MNIILQLFWDFHDWPLNHEVKLNSKKNMGLINRLLQLQLSELFRTLTQGSRSLLLLKEWERKGHHLLGVHTKLDLNRFHWKFILMIQNVYVEQTNPWRQSREWIRCKLEQKIFSSLLPSRYPSRQPSSSVFVGKVSAKLLWEKTTISL